MSQPSGRTLRVQVREPASPKPAGPADSAGHLAISPNRTSAVLSRLVDVDINALKDSIASTVGDLAAAFKPGAEGGPTQCEVTFGLSISTEGSVFLASIGTDLNIEVKLTWG